MKRRPRLTNTFHIYKFNVRREPTHYPRRGGHEAPGVVAVLCECLAGTGFLIFVCLF